MKHPGNFRLGARALARRVILATLERIEKRASAGEILTKEEAEFALSVWKSERAMDSIDAQKPVGHLLGVSTSRLIEFIRGEIHVTDVPSRAVEPEEPIPENGGHSEVRAS